MALPGFVERKLSGEVKDAISMEHCNKHAVCVVDIETNGPIPFYHEIIQMCVVVLTPALKPNKTIIPFYTAWKPRHPLRADFDNMRIRKPDYYKIVASSLDSHRVADLFEEWFIKKLKLRQDKQIMPLAYNWARIYPFLVAWLGYENFNHIFHPLQYRDLICAGLVENDKADHHVEPVPFPKHNLQYYTSQLKVQRTRPHNNMQDCVVIAECYRRLLKQGAAVLRVVDDLPDEIDESDRTCTVTTEPDVILPVFTHANESIEEQPDVIEDESKITLHSYANQPFS